MSHFDFIGDYEKYESELTRLGKQLELPFKANVRLNVTSGYMANQGLTEVMRLSIVDAEYAKLAEILEDDIEFYQVHKGK